MKPLEFEKITAPFLESRLLMLNAGMLGTRYVARLLGRGATSVTSKGGLALPAELWGNILPMARDKAYVLVEARLVSEAEGGKVLECREVSLDRSAGHLFDTFEVDLYESVLNTRGSAKVFLLDENSEPPEIVAGESTYQVVVEAGEKHPCVFEEITVPDVIARLEGGRCALCSGERFVCPMHNDEFKDFVGVIVRIGCRGDLACPLCLANVFHEHMDFLEAYDYDPPTKRERKRMNLSIKKALRELGYPAVLK